VRLAPSHAAHMHEEAMAERTRGRTRGSRACTNAGQQSVHAAECAHGAGRECGQARSQRAQRLGSINLTTFCRGERGCMREQQRRHAGQQSVHAAERALGAGRGCSLARGWAWALVDRPPSFGDVRIPNAAASRRTLRAPLRRRQERSATATRSRYARGRDKHRTGRRARCIPLEGPPLPSSTPSPEFSLENSLI
jgi:hypothetical protein